MTTTPVMRAENIVKELGSGAGLVVAVKGVSLDLVPGELTLLMGPSGSGKTTLLSILGCILKPTSGSLRIADTVIDGLSAEELAKVRRDHIGFIFQSYNLFPTLSALENVRIALDVRGIKGFAATSRSEEVLREATLVVYPRKDAEIGKLPAGVRALEMERVPGASSEIRAALSEGQSPEAAGVLPQIRDYVRRHGLYGVHA